MENLIGRIGDLLGQWDEQREMGTAPAQVPKVLEAWLKQRAAVDKNPWNPAMPAFKCHIEVVSNLDRGGVERRAASQATVLGEVVWVIELPMAGRPGYLGGAVRTQASVNGSSTFTKVTELE